MGITSDITDTTDTTNTTGINNITISEHQKKGIETSVDDALYIHAATSYNTRLAYQADIQDFQKKGGVLPATPERLENYLREGARHYNPRTLTRRMTALRQWHKLKGFSDPTESPLVIKTLRGIARLHGKPKKQALALRLEDLDQILHYLKKQNDLKSIRNRALVLLGFFGAFRRSELVSLTWENVHFVRDGMTITLPRSKTDQTGEGRRCVIPFGNDTRCPVRALIDWRQSSGQWEGVIFRRISKVGALSDQAISPRYWNRLLQQLAKEAGIPNSEQISSHSLRRGFATEAARLGASLVAIQRHGRWRTTRTVVEYIEAGREFTDSAVKVLFKY